MSTDNKLTVQQAAKNGNPQAIAILLNRQLQPKGISVKVSAKNSSFSIILEAIKIPPQVQLVNFIRQLFGSLEIDTWQTVKIYARKIGEDFPDWHEEFTVEKKPVLSIKDLAKQGNVKAISTLLCQHLPKEIATKFIIKDDCLQVMLEAPETPNQRQMELLLRTEILKLEIQAVKKIRIYGKQSGEDFPDWHSDISFVVMEEIVNERLAIEENNSEEVDGIALSNDLYIVLEETCYEHLIHRVSLEDDKNIHELVQYFVDDLEDDLKHDLERFAKIANDLFMQSFNITIEFNKMQSLIYTISNTGFTKVKLAIRELEKVTQQVLQVDLPEDNDALNTFFRGAADEALAQFSGKTTVSHEAMLGATIGSFVAPVIGTMIGGAIGAWFGGERQQKEIDNLIEKYEKARSNLFKEWDSLLKLVYSQTAKLINEVSSVELLTYETIDKANDLCNKGNDFLNSEEQFLKAIEFYDKAISLNPRLAMAWNNKGYVLNQLEQYEDALIVLEKAKQIDPTFIGAFNNYGDALQGLENYEEAIIIYDECIELDPENYQAWWNRGFCLANIEKYELALESFEKLIQIDNEHPNTWLVLCIKSFYYIDLNNFNEAINSLTKAVKINPSKSREYISETEQFNCLTEDTRFQELMRLSFTTFEQVQEIVASQLDVDKSEVNPETSFENDLGADDLDLIELMMALEEMFGVEIPDEDVYKIATVQIAVDYIDSKQAA